MSTATATKLLTAEEFARLPDPPDGSKQELVKGEVVTMPPPSFVHGKVQNNVAYALETHNRTRPSGHVTVESGLVTERDLDTVRGPDVAFWSFDRVPDDKLPAVYPEVAADLVAEVLSPGNTRRQVRDKLREYFRAGVRLVWVADPDDRSVTAYTRPGSGTTLWEDEAVTGGDVLPGFTCPVAEFFRGVPATE
ncbi:MAG: Uma2 family endonuclease [Gemmataceae bacterium]|nr:Uma2 family endonuclease [Gemmataceae bacterium]